MAEKILKTRVVNKNDIAENWNKATNFIPKCGELIIFNPTVDQPYVKVKIGDNINNINNLPFLGDEKVDHNTTYTLTKEDDNIILTGSDGSSMSVADNGGSMIKTVTWTTADIR